MENQNLTFKIKALTGEDHDLVISPENVAALAAGASVEMGGKLYKAKITVYVSATEAKYFSDQPPYLELEAIA